MQTRSSKTESSELPIRRSSRIKQLQEAKIRNKSNFVSSAQNHKVNKSPLTTAFPVQHHSTTIRSESKVNQTNTSVEAADCNVANQNLHPNRMSNLLRNFERNKKEKLQLPAPNDPIWKEVDSELKIAIPKVFTKSIMNSNSQKLTEKYENWIYEFFKGKFGTVPPFEKKPTFVKKTHKGLVRLREDKSVYAKLYVPWNELVSKILQNGICFKKRGFN